MAFTLTEKVGDVVARLPKAGEVFKQRGIDFCCGGNRPLDEVAAEHGLDPVQFLDQLNALYEETKAANELGTDWTEEPLDKLVEHIVNKHHAFLHTTLPALGELVTKILRVHGMNHWELTTVHRLYHSLKAEFEEHLIKEETMVFPLITEYAQSGCVHILDKAVSAIEELEREHDKAGEILKELDKITGGYKVPEDACGTYQYTFQKLASVEEDTFLHVHLENNILFPRLRSKKCELPA